MEANKKFLQWMGSLYRFKKHSRSHCGGNLYQVKPGCEEIGYQRQSFSMAPISEVTNVTPRHAFQMGVDSFSLERGIPKMKTS